MTASSTPRHLAARSFRSRALDNAAKTYRKQAAHDVPGITWQLVPPRDGGGRYRDRSEAQTAQDLRDLDVALGRLPIPTVMGLEDHTVELAEVRDALNTPIDLAAVSA